MKKSIFYLLSLFIASFLIVTVLVYTAPDPDKQLNGFSRQYLQPTPIPAFATIPTLGNIREILGIFRDKYFLYATNDPATVFLGDTLLKDLPQKNKLGTNIPKALRDSMGNDFFTLTEGSLAYICGYNIPTVHVSPVVSPGPMKDSNTIRRLPYGGFSQAVLMRNGDLMLRKLEPGIKDQLFMRLNMTTYTLTREDSLSDIYHDGGMRTDGSLNYDAITGLLTYVHYYSNSYFTFDSSMHLTAKGHTIDTFSRYRFELADRTTTKGNLFTAGGPDRMVNAHSCVHNGTLYVNSKIKADNDDHRFRRYNVIDMYELATNTYKGSLYLDIPAGAKISQLYVRNSTMLARCEDSIYAIRLTH